jgi:hypothetical protein
VEAQENQSVQAPVELRLDGLFGPDVSAADSYTPLVVRATNRTQSTLQGEVVVTVRGWDSTLAVHRLHLDLPPGEMRQALFSVPSFNGGTMFHAEYVAGSVLASVDTTMSGNAMNSIVLLDDPPRLRGALAGLEAPDQYGTPRPIPIGQVSTDPRSGDLLLPREAAGWSPVAVVIATVPALGRAGETELRALETWLEAGGHLLLIPIGDSDLAHPFVRRVVGTLERSASTGQLACSAPSHVDPVGCRAALGFGTVWISSVDFTEPARLVDPNTRDGIRELVDRATFEPRRQLIRSFRTPPATVAGLDPNQGYRPALLFVGLVFFVYVVLVGPVNFTWVQRRKQPTLALISTPILAFLCALLVFVIGYLGKGVIMRYRRIEFVEAHEGSPRGMMVRNTGFFYTRPASATLTLDEGIVGLRYNANVTSGPVNEGGTRERLEGMRAGLWETAFVREEGVRDMGGGVHFELDGNRIARLRNESPFTLHNAFMTDVLGNLYPIGEVAPGASAEVPTSARSYISPGSSLGSSEYDAATLAFLGMLGFNSQAIGPVSSLPSTNEIVSFEVPMFYARLDPAAPPDISPAFERDLDLRLLRIVPDLIVDAPRAAENTPTGGAVDPPPVDASAPDAGGAQ